jgi:hypothetical protein
MGPVLTKRLSLSINSGDLDYGDFFDRGGRLAAARTLGTELASLLREEMRQRVSAVIDGLIGAGQLVRAEGNRLAIGAKYQLGGR